MKAIFLVLLSLLSPAVFAEAYPPLPCQYGNPIFMKGPEDGSPIKLFRQVGSDWFGKYKILQFCRRPDHASEYVLWQEELFRGMKVINPPREIVSSTGTSDGGSVLELLSPDGAKITLEVSMDQTRIRVFESNPAIDSGARRLKGVLELVWTKR